MIQLFAGLDALVPRVMKLGVTSTSAVFEPRTTATATTSFARFRDGAAFGADGTNGRRFGCWCVHVGIGQNKQDNKKRENSRCLVCARISLHWVSLGLTFAGRDALKPPVTSVSVAGTSSAVLIPSTARSATTVSNGFLEFAALWTRRHTNDR